MTLESEIRINDNYAQLLTSEYKDTRKDDSTPIIRNSTTYTSKYIDKISQLFSSQSQVLPANCRYLENTTKGPIVVIEEPPAYRTIKVNYGFEREILTLEADGKIDEWGIDKNFYMDENNRPFKFTLAFPYVVFILMFDVYNRLRCGQVYLRVARIGGYSDYLLKMPMMNIGSEGFICFGPHINDTRYTQSLNTAIEHTIMVFWSAVFNSDYLYNYEDYRRIAGVNTYIGWQALSQIDPMFIYNVDWIKMNKTLRQTIDEIKHKYAATQKNTTSYHELANLFTKPLFTGKSDEFKKGKGKYPLYYDIAQGIYLRNKFLIHVGDPIIWNNKIAFIDSFIGYFDSDEIRYIRLELEGSKKVITVKYTKQIENYMYKGAKKLRYEDTGTLKNGTIVKENDIIKMKQNGTTSYRKIFFIRKARDGKLEARIGSAFYILDNIEGEIYNIDDISYHGLKLEEGKNYLVIRRDLNKPLQAGDITKYSEVDTSPSGNLSFIFNKNTDHISIESTSNAVIYQIEDVKPIPPVFNVGRQLLCTNYDNKLIENSVWDTPSGIVYKRRNINVSAPSISEVETVLLTNDRTTFHIEGHNSQITFDIGDKVVHTDWENPMNMLTIKTIISFKIDQTKGSLSFVLADSNDNLTTVEYISPSKGTGTSEKYCSTVHIGKIRKISNIFNGITAGTKIQATKGYIPQFPKKDVNIIIGFITDTGGDDPLVLCSNCCTLWFSDMMENFKRTAMKSKQWATMQHALIDTSKIQYQPGDIIKHNQSNTSYIVINYMTQNTPKILALYKSSGGICTLDKHITAMTRLDCIPNPRIGPSIQTEMPKEPGYPNFHGLFYKNLRSQLKFLNDGRSFINV